MSVMRPPQEYMIDEWGWFVEPPPPKKIVDHLHLIYVNGFAEMFRVYGIYDDSLDS